MMMSSQRSRDAAVCRHDVETMNIRLESIQEQVVVVTGASSGIGLVTAGMAAQRGARLAPSEVVEKGEGKGAA